MHFLICCTNFNFAPILHLSASFQSLCVLLTIYIGKTIVQSIAHYFRMLDISHHYCRRVTLFLLVKKILLGLINLYYMLSKPECTAIIWLAHRTSTFKRKWLWKLSFWGANYTLYCIENEYRSKILYFLRWASMRFWYYSVCSLFTESLQY